MLFRQGDAEMMLALSLLDMLIFFSKLGTVLIAETPLLY